MATAHTAYKSITDETLDLDVRNDLILQELPQVHFIATRILERLPQQVELSDLVNAGVLGLLEAYRTFDSTKNAQFTTFARFRIRGAILDSLRALDWGSRGIRRKGREIAEATSQLQNSLGRTPTKEELASALRVTVSQLNETQTQLHGLHVVGQQIASSAAGEGGDLHDLVESARSTWDNPFEMYCKSESRAQLAAALAQLSEREQLILSLYYQEELTMKEVAQVVGIAVSRVSQIHFASLAKLKLALTHLQPVPKPASPARKTV